MASTLRQAGFPLSNPYGGTMAMPPLPFQASGVPSPNAPQTQQNPSLSSTTAGSTPSTTAAGTTPNLNTIANQGGAGTRLPGAGASGSPFGMIDPALMQQLMGMGSFGGGLGAGGLGAGGLGAGGFGAFGGSPTPPADTRAPEERFEAQLQVSPTLTNCAEADQQP